MKYRFVHASSCRAGFTIVELLLSLSILAVILLVITSMLFAIGASTAGEQERRSRLHRRQVATERAAAVFRSARRVLAHDTARTVLWMRDTDQNLQPRLSELCVVAWDSEAQEVACFRTPEGLSEEFDPSFELDSDFLSETAPFMGAAVLPGVHLLNNLADWRVDPDAPTVAEARLVTLRFTFVSEPSDERSIIVAALRHQ